MNNFHTKSSAEKSAVLGTVLRWGGKAALGAASAIGRAGFKAGKFGARKPLNRIGMPIFAGMSYAAYKNKFDQGGLNKSRRSFPKAASETSTMNSSERRQSLISLARNKEKLASCMVKSAAEKYASDTTRAYDMVNTPGSIQEKEAGIASAIGSLFLKKTKLPIKDFLGSKEMQRYATGSTVDDAVAGSQTMAGKLLREAVDDGDDVLAEMIRNAQRRHTKAKMRSMYREAQRDIPAGYDNAYAPVNWPVVAMAGGAAAAGAGGYMMAREQNEKRRLQDTYDKMLEVVPELKDANPAEVAQYHNYINEYSPTVARNPYAAGTMIKRVIHSDGALMDTNAIQSLYDIEAQKNKSRTDHYGVSGKLTENLRNTGIRLA